MANEAPVEFQLTNKKNKKQVLTLGYDHAKNFLLLEKKQHKENYQVTSPEGWTFDYKNKDFIKKA